MDWASIASAGAGVLGTLATGIVNNGISKATRNWQSEENALNRNWQEGENAASRSFTAYENKLSRDWQERMWNLENQYNSPSAMMQRYREAGLNPYLASSVGQGAGAAPAGSAGTPATSSSAPMGSPSMVGAPAAFGFGDLGSNLLNALGVSANVANQNAKTIQQKWETYQYIRQHVGSDAAKKYLDSNPDMFQSGDPDNDPWMRAYRRSEVRETIQNENADFEYNLRQLYGVKEAELQLYKLKNQSDDLLSQIQKRDADIKEIDALIRKINEQIKTEKSLQAKNYSEADLARAKTQTEDESRMYVIRQLLLNTNILDFAEQTDRSIFESKESLRGWLTSSQGKEFIREAYRTGVGTQTDYLLRAIYGILGNTGAHLNFSSSSSSVTHNN